jgi:hypothetical protein
MTAPTIADYLKYANLQMAAEASVAWTSEAQSGDPTHPALRAAK